MRRGHNVFVVGVARAARHGAGLLLNDQKNCSKKLCDGLNDTKMMQSGKTPDQVEARVELAISSARRVARALSRVHIKKFLTFVE